MILESLVLLLAKVLTLSKASLLYRSLKILGLILAMELLNRVLNLRAIISKSWNSSNTEIVINIFKNSWYLSICAYVV